MPVQLSVRLQLNILEAKFFSAVASDSFPGQSIPWSNVPTSLVLFRIAGVSGRKWILAAKSIATTLVSSFAGGTFALLYSALYANKGKVDILIVINGILGALVGITAGVVSQYDIREMQSGMSSVAAAKTNKFSKP